MSTSRMQFTSPNKSLNQSSEGLYVHSHLFPSTSSIGSNAMREQEETYLKLNPQRTSHTQAGNTTSTNNNSYPTQLTNQPTQNESTFKYYISTPYKHSSSSAQEKSPTSELPPTRSVYDVVGGRVDTGSYADTSMGDADVSMTAEGERSAQVSANTVDWDGLAKSQSRGEGGRFALNFNTTPQHFFEHHTASPIGLFETPTSQHHSRVISESPPFKGSILGDMRPTQEVLWLTVFGFPATQVASNIVLNFFKDLGDVVEFEQPVGVNWLHVCYVIRQHADRALSKNGKLIGEFMIGVIPKPHNLPSAAPTIAAKDPNKIYDRNELLLPPKEQSWFKSMIAFTFG